MFFKKEEDNSSMKHLANVKGEMLILSGSIVGESFMHKRGKDIPSVRIKTKKGTHEIIFNSYTSLPPEIKIGSDVTIAVTKEIGTYSKMVKMFPTTNGGLKMNSMVISEHTDASKINVENANNVIVNKKIKPNDIWVRETKKEEYLSYQFLIP